MPELDSLRGVAILAVLLYHGFAWKFGATGFPRPASVFMNITRGGWAGVNLFFILSGFLITGILLEAKASPDYYHRFYRRRILRILPAYYAILILLTLFGGSRPLTARSLPAHFSDSASSTCPTSRRCWEFRCSFPCSGHSR